MAGSTFFWKKISPKTKQKTKQKNKTKKINKKTKKQTIKIYVIHAKPSKHGQCAILPHSFIFITYPKKAPEPSKMSWNTGKSTLRMNFILTRFWSTLATALVIYKVNFTLDGQFKGLKPFPSLNGEIPKFEKLSIFRRIRPI